VSPRVTGRDVISIFSRGGTILTDFLGGGGQNRKKQKKCAKTQKFTIFGIQGAKGRHLAPPNDVPWYRPFISLIIFDTRVRFDSRLQGVFIGLAYMTATVAVYIPTSIFLCYEGHVAVYGPTPTNIRQI